MEVQNNEWQVVDAVGNRRRRERVSGERPKGKRETSRGMSSIQVGEHRLVADGEVDSLGGHRQVLVRKVPTLISRGMRRR